MGMLPLLIVALLVWAGVFFYLLRLDKNISALERKISEKN
jgi:CcmD family protein